MRPFKITPKFLTDLRERLTIAAAGQPDIARAMMNVVVLGDVEEMAAGSTCTVCQGAINLGFLLPGVGYVDANCGVLLVVQGLIDRGDIFHPFNSLVLPMEPRPIPSPGMVTEGVQWPQELPPPTTEVDLRFVHPARHNREDVDAMLQRGEITREKAEEMLCEITPSPDEAFDAVKLSAYNQHPERPLAEPDSDPGSSREIPPVPKVLNEMKAYTQVPKGTVMRVPIKTLRPGSLSRPEPYSHATPAAHEWAVQIADPASVTTKKASESGVVIERPEVDLSALAPEEQAEFEGYTPGRFQFRNATDVHRYERAFGDSTLMQSLQEADDEELGPGERELRRRQEERAAAGFGSATRSEDGVMRMRTFDPLVREARLARETGETQFEPLQPID